jgi:3-phenylpropionate/cinnamic acid dioxygenase small subunit
VDDAHRLTHPRRDGQRARAPTDLGAVIGDEADGRVEGILACDTKEEVGLIHAGASYCLAVGAGTWDSHHAITSLMYRYAEYIDAGDFDAIAELFAGAILTNEGVDGEVAGGAAIAELYRRTNRVHDDGTLRTRHVTANVLVDIDEAAGTASARSSFVVLQQTPALPLQPIATGRYRDRFERDGDEWRFVQRHIIVDHVGDVREHLAFDLARFLEQ